MDNRDRDLDKSISNPARDDDENVGGKLVGEAVGGVSGIAAGMALGSLGGPVGAVIGGLAGAIGGWWSGRAIAEAAMHYTEADDAAYRSHYETSAARLADRSYDDVRPAYQLGHLAGRNPDYAGRSFDEVETDLRSGWTTDVSSRYGEWDSVRGYARDAYERGRLDAAGATGAAAYGASRTGDAVDRAGDATRDAARDVARGAEHAWDKTKTGAERLGDKVADKADDLKDRVDANPASRPGPDPTDRPGR